MSEPKIEQVITAYRFLHHDNGNVTVLRQQTIKETDGPEFLSTTVVNREVQIDHHNLFQAMETVSQNNDLNRLMDEYSKMKSLDKQAKVISDSKHPDPVLEKWARSGHKSKTNMFTGINIGRMENGNLELDAEEIIENFKKRQPDNFVKASEKRIIEEIIKHINKNVVIFPRKNI